MTTKLHDTTLELRDRLILLGAPLPFALKRRDPKEPGRRHKERTEDALYAAFLSHFRRQKAYIRQTITRISPERKTLFGYDADYYLSYLNDLPADDRFIAKIVRLLASASATGIDIFSEMMPLQIDYTLVNEAAAKWALDYAGDMITKIDETTLNTVRTVLSDFVSTPGMTIGDIMARLPFSESRALLIAVDQTTNVYANADRMAGEALQAEYPDVMVIKRWYTNADDRVCPICQPMDGLVVPIDEPFIHPVTGQAYDGPSAHIRCRCWRSTTTNIEGTIDPAEYGGKKP